MARYEVTYNLTCNVWAAGLDPSVDPPTYTDVPCQVYVPSRSYNQYSVGGDLQLSSYLRIPVDLTQVHDIAYHYEAPPGSGFFLACIATEWVHKGFFNEYWAIICVRSDSTGTGGYSQVP